MEVNPHFTSRSCPRCGWVVSRMVGKTFRCEKCGLTLDRQYNASLNIMKRFLNKFNLKMWGFPYKGVWGNPPNEDEKNEGSNLRLR